MELVPENLAQDFWLLYVAAELRLVSRSVNQRNRVLRSRDDALVVSLHHRIAEFIDLLPHHLSPFAERAVRNPGFVDGGAGSDCACRQVVNEHRQQSKNELHPCRQRAVVCFRPDRYGPKNDREHERAQDIERRPQAIECELTHGRAEVLLHMQILFARASPVTVTSVPGTRGITDAFTLELANDGAG